MARSSFPPRGEDTRHTEDHAITTRRRNLSFFDDHENPAFYFSRGPCVVLLGLGPRPGELGSGCSGAREGNAGRKTRRNPEKDEARLYILVSDKIYIPVYSRSRTINRWVK